MKDSFVIYKSFYEPIKSLSDKQLGRLFKAIFDYQVDGSVQVDADIQMAFAFFKNQFDIDERKYQEVVQRNKQNGLKGGRPSNNENPKNPVGYKKPKKADNDNDNDNENENDNVNDNDNEKGIVKGKNISSISLTPKKHKHGEYKHVLLTDEQYAKLLKDYANAEEYIKYLDEYIEMKGYKANNHNLAIRKWVIDAVEKEKRGKFNSTVKIQEPEYYKTLKEEEGDLPF